MAKRKKVDVEEETISSIAEFSEDIEGLSDDEEDYYLSDDAEEKLDEYLEGGVPAIIHPDLAPVEVNDDYPTSNHVYCRTKASKTHREIAPEFNHTLIIREKK